MLESTRCKVRYSPSTSTNRIGTLHRTTERLHGQHVRKHLHLLGYIGDWSTIREEHKKEPKKPKSTLRKTPHHATIHRPPPHPPLLTLTQDLHQRNNPENNRTHLPSRPTSNPAPTRSRTRRRLLMLIERRLERQLARRIARLPEIRLGVDMIRDTIRPAGDVVGLGFAPVVAA